MIFVHFNSKLTDIKSSLLLNEIQDSIQIDRLQRNLKLNKAISKRKILNSEEKTFAIYFSDYSCSSCVESLLLVLSETGVWRDEFIVIVDDIDKFSYVEKIKEMYDKSFEIHYELSDPIKDLTEVLFLELESGKIKFCLEYKPDEREAFLRLYNGLYGRR